MPDWLFYALIFLPFGFAAGLGFARITRRLRDADAFLKASGGNAQ